MSELFASPLGCLLLAERSRSAAELIAPAERTTTSALYDSCSPLRSTCTVLIARPVSSVSSRDTSAPVRSSTFWCSKAGSTQPTCASDFALTRQGNPSQVEQRMHLLRCGFLSSSIIPSGTLKG